MIAIKRLLTTAILLGTFLLCPTLAQAGLATVNEDYVLLGDNVITVSGEEYLPIKEVMAGANANVIWGADSQDKILVVADGKRYQINLSTDQAGNTIAGTSRDNMTYPVQVQDGHAYFPLSFYKEILNRELTYIESMGRLNYVDDQPVWWAEDGTTSNVKPTIKNLSAYTVEETSRSSQDKARVANASAASTKISDNGIPVDNEGMLWPTTATRVSSPYGARGGGFHTGIDIDGDTGDAVYAAWSGKVISAGWSGGYGNCIDLLHADGSVTRYAHLNQIAVTNGSIVTRGQVIGQEGSTGKATGDHLHFEVRRGGNTYNPLDYVSVSRRS